MARLPRLLVRLVAAFALAFPPLAAPAQVFENATSVTVPASITLTGGSLQIQPQGGHLSFAPVDLSAPGALRSVGRTAPTWLLGDSRGTGEGWHVTLQASAPPRFRVCYDPRHGASTLVAAPGTPAGPREAGGGPRPLDTPQRVVSAAAGAGMGQYAWSPEPGGFTLDLPAGASAGSWSLTLTATLVSGP